MLREFREALAVFEDICPDWDDRLQAFARSPYYVTGSWTGGATLVLPMLGIQPGSGGILKEAKFPYGMDVSAQTVGFDPKQAIAGHGQFTSPAFAMALATEMHGFTAHSCVERGNIAEIPGIIGVGAGISNENRQDKRARNGATFCIGVVGMGCYEQYIVELDIEKGLLTRGQQDAIFTMAFANAMFCAAGIEQTAFPAERYGLTSPQFVNTQEGCIFALERHLVTFDRVALDREGALLYGIDGGSQELKELDPSQMVFIPLTARPMTSAHLQLIRSASIRATRDDGSAKEPVVILSMSHHSKGMFDEQTMIERISQFTGTSRVLVLEKGAYFRDMVHFIRSVCGPSRGWHDIVELAVGFDAPEILLNPDRYDGATETERRVARNRTLSEIWDCTARFLVAPRQGKLFTRDLLPLIPKGYEALFAPLPAQTGSVSSTEYRKVTDSFRNRLRPPER